MTRQVAPYALVLALALPVIAHGQAKPDFSGTWMVNEKEPSTYNGSNGWGVPSTMVIKQSATEITIESGQFAAQPMRVVYKLDGSDNIWDASGSSQSGVTTTVKWRTKAKWDGDKLVLFTWNTALNQMRDIMTLSGGSLTVTRATEQPGPSTNAVLTYRKGT
jgi:hypothetical protein